MVAGHYQKKKKKTLTHQMDTLLGPSNVLSLAKCLSDLGIYLTSVTISQNKKKQF
jgi:NADH:ubiquinone oxidoreductase subunit B-like Fe-S oxidoreductase